MELTGTSFAILTLLEERPWSAYELATHWEQSVLALLLPRARSNVYREPKRLEQEGLVTSTTEPSQALFGRTRTLYTITDEGRRARAAWREGASEPAFIFESEVLLRLALDDGTDPELLLKSVQAIRNQVLERRAVRQAMRNGEGERGDLAHLSLVGRVDEVMLDWCTEMEDRARELPTGSTDGLLDRDGPDQRQARPSS